jgi:hypothetical protein
VVPQGLGTQGYLGYDDLGFAFARLPSLRLGGPNPLCIFLARLDSGERARQTGDQHRQFDGGRHGKNT